MKPVRTYVINAVTAAAVSLAAITSGAVPATAKDKDDDMLKVLAGIVAVAVFAGVLNQQQQNRGAVSRAQPLPVQPALPAWQAPDPGWQDGRWQDGRWQRDDWRNHRADTRGGPRLPGVCAMEFGNASRPAVYYAEPCLRREGAGYGLPQYCAQQIRTRDYQGRAFEAECLREAGYRTETWR
jgi:hypothetical protein